MKPTIEIALEIVEQSFVGLSDESKWCLQAITSALNSERERAEKFKKALEDILNNIGCASQSCELIASEALRGDE